MIGATRRIKNIEYSRGFLKATKKLPERIIKQAEKKEEVFRSNPYAPQLDTHKLSGRGRETWAFSINRSYRIRFLFLKDEEVLFLDIGTHNIYKK